MQQGWVKMWMSYLACTFSNEHLYEAGTILFREVYLAAGK